MSKIFNSKASIRAFLKTMRIHQYAKNSLIFLPFLLSHELTNVNLILLTAFGFICFSLIASSAYFLNDLVDMQSDRLHPTKKFRPLASGQLSLSAGIAGAVACFLLGMLISTLTLPFYFTLMLIFYYLCTLAYSFKLKKLLLIDVFSLAILYTLRIVAGMSIMGVAGYSNWLLLFSFFFFTSLAFIKRYSELKRHESGGREKLPGRAYQIDHANEIKIFGLCSGFSSILIFTLYVQSEKSLKLYHHSQILFLICPLLLYWILRAWLIAVDGKMNDDPVVFALKDRVTYGIGLAIVVLTIIAAM